MSSLLESLANDTLAQIKQLNRFRELLAVDNKRYPIDLSHNDYLGLRNDLVLRAQILQKLNELPFGSGASRLLGGEHLLFQELEQKFAMFKNAPSALFFPSGYAANEAVATVLCFADSHFFSDELNHASIIDGICLSKLPKERLSIYPHADFGALEQALRQSPAAIKIIFTESLFSMDGDITDLKQLFTLALQYQATLVIDEAHAVGCFGYNGNGLISEFNLDHGQHISINTCGKGLAVQGAIVCGPNWLRDLLINKARPFIYTTAPSPWLAQALISIIDYMPQLAQKRQLLHSYAAEIRTTLTRAGYDLKNSTSHVVPIICGSEQKAMDLARALGEHGIYIKAIRPPTVGENESRLRLSLHAGLTSDHVSYLKDIFIKLREKLNE